ncbi:MAG TPA: DUF488 domain-containing protein [Nitrospirae bacterium]|nr:hypothetical protein BMS3Abin10_01211 [bacterium BMS3Abin10]GBE38429.1 hypothetical protein BMS3Bbin08_01035 [bacterium BMS3Bbin08]HDH00501.1 DUF488 domain-containing protein [Nitrospirota bacterium]HDH51386.1 DUF488 domain-containing protein [Nitrospirota bacterium]HDO26464.1 DUF488 domain-containing protein [Nitrospirota bacterium]
MKHIYTLGTGLRSLEDFTEIITGYGIGSVIDVRSFPTSKLDHFKRASLESSLKNEMFEYHFLGRELGGFRKGGYEKYTRTKEFEQGIDRLEELASDITSVIICAEHFPWKCHRRFIAMALKKRGWQVIHIIDKGKEWIPK